jgi:hypothetical protein
MPTPQETFPTSWMLGFQGFCRPSTVRTATATPCRMDHVALTRCCCTPTRAAPRNTASAWWSRVPAMKNQRFLMGQSWRVDPKLSKQNWS